MRFIRRATLAAVAATAAITLVACTTTDETASEATSETTSETMVEETTEETAVEEMTDETNLKPAGTVVELASDVDQYSTLVTALDAAGLVETLNGEGPFTVFAPTNDAFAALPPGLLDALLLPENKDTLVKVLTYHVIPGAVMSAQVTDGDVATVEGQTVTLSTADGVTVNGARVINANLEATNGVVHGIDAVILPPDVDAQALLGE